MSPDEKSNSIPVIEKMEDQTPKAWRLLFTAGIHSDVEVDIPEKEVLLGGATSDDIPILDVESSLLSLTPARGGLVIKVLCETALIEGKKHKEGETVFTAEPIRIDIQGVGMSLGYEGKYASEKLVEPSISEVSLGDFAKRLPYIAKIKKSPHARLFIGGGAASAIVMAVVAFHVVTNSGGVRCSGKDCVAQNQVGAAVASNSSKQVLNPGKGSSQRPVDVLRDLLAGYRVPARIEVTPHRLRVHHAMEDASRFAQVRGEIEAAMAGQRIEWTLANEDTLLQKTTGGARSLARLAVSRLEDNGLEATARRFFSGNGRIVQVMTGETPSVSNNRGARLYRGADLGNGLTLAEITEQFLVVEDSHQRRVVLTHEGQRTRFGVNASEGVVMPSLRRVDMDLSNANDKEAERSKSETRGGAADRAETSRESAEMVRVVLKDSQR
jgi:hypothetical protein